MVKRVFFIPTLFKQYVNNIYLTIFLALKNLKKHAAIITTITTKPIGAFLSSSTERKYGTGFCASPVSLTVRNESKSEPPHTP